MSKIAAGLLAGVLTFAHPAAARAGGIAFWGYWQAKDGKWAFAATGPAQAHPKDGTVEGWRFARSSGNTGTPPRDEPAFSAICGSASGGSGAPPGKKRVAVVIDYGVPADAPQGQVPPPAVKRYCATVPENATGLDVLTAAGRVNTDKSGLICAIDAYGPCGAPGPSRTAGTGAPSATASPRAGEKGGSGTPIGLYAGAAVIVLVAAGGGVAAWRRSRR